MLTFHHSRTAIDTWDVEVRVNGEPFYFLDGFRTEQQAIAWIERERGGSLIAPAAVDCLELPPPLGHRHLARKAA